MSSRQKRSAETNQYTYRPFSEDEKMVDHMLRVWAGVAVEAGFDVGTKKCPSGTPAARKHIAAEARVVFEAMGLLPADFQERPSDDVQPVPEEANTTRPRCTHAKCGKCERCHCDGAYVRGAYCEECTWLIKQESGRRATTVRKGRRTSEGT